MKAKQVKKEPEPKKDILTTTHRRFNKGERVRLESIGADGNYETGVIDEVIKDYAGRMSHYTVILDSDTSKRLRVSVWFVKGMDSPERPKKG